MTIKLSDNEYVYFRRWLRKQQRVFYSGQYNEREIAYSAFCAGRRFEKESDLKGQKDEGKDEAQPSSMCIWQRHIDDDGYVHFDTSCHYGFGLDVIGNGPLSNHWGYCPLCGLKLEIKQEIGK